MSEIRTALVTGATSGIGTAIARQLAADGFEVVVTGRDRTRGAAVVSTIQKDGGSAWFLELDLAADPEQLRTLVIDLPQPVNVLVNNAAIYPVAATGDLPDDDARRLLHVNVLAPHALTSVLAPQMAIRGFGVIVNVSSWMARLGTPRGALYSATKAALDQLTRSWAAEYGPDGVRVNAVAPGMTLTEGNQAHEASLRQAAASIPGRALVFPSDIADAVSFLASDRAAKIHGTTLVVDGGISMSR